MADAAPGGPADDASDVDDPAVGGGAVGGEAGAGADAARTALNRARTAAGRRGGTARAPGSVPGPSAGQHGGRWGRPPGAISTGARPDGRDPQPLGGSLGRLVSERGWQRPVAVGGVLGRWGQVVGPELSQHCSPERFEDGVLTVRAASTAWATQVRLLAPLLLQRLGEELGPDVVTRLVVRGPSAPSWRSGPRVVSDGRGPRDTYG